jgi:hypothetical protein
VREKSFFSLNSLEGIPVSFLVLFIVMSNDLFFFFLLFRSEHGYGLYYILVL